MGATYGAGWHRGHREGREMGRTEGDVVTERLPYVYQGACEAILGLAWEAAPPGLTNEPEDRHLSPPDN